MSQKDKPVLTADFIVRKDAIPQQINPPSEEKPQPRTVTSLRLRGEDNTLLRHLAHHLQMTKTELVDEALELLRERYKDV
jgi:hypothetical protein